MAQNIRSARVEANWMLHNILGNSHGHLSFPVDVVRILHVLDIAVVYTEEKPGLMDAVVEWRENAERAYVLISSDEDDERTRHMLAIAIGLVHYTNVTRAAKDTIFLGVDTLDERMVYAEEFALHLIAPENAVMERHSNGFNVGALSRIFEVEESVIADVLVSTAVRH